MSMFFSFYFFGAFQGIIISKRDLQQVYFVVEKTISISHPDKYV